MDREVVPSSERPGSREGPHERTLSQPVAFEHAVARFHLLRPPFENGDFGGEENRTAPYALRSVVPTQWRVGSERRFGSMARVIADGGGCLGSAGGITERYRSG